MVSCVGGRGCLSRAIVYESGCIAEKRTGVDGFRVLNDVSNGPRLRGRWTFSIRISRWQLGWLVGANLLSVSDT